MKFRVFTVLDDDTFIVEAAGVDIKGDQVLFLNKLNNIIDIFNWRDVYRIQKIDDTNSMAAAPRIGVYDQNCLEERCKYYSSKLIDNGKTCEYLGDCSRNGGGEDCSCHGIYKYCKYRLEEIVE